MLCSYSNRTSEAPHTSAANHGNTFIDGMMFFFTANFTRDMTTCIDQTATQNIANAFVCKLSNITFGKFLIA